MFTKAIWIVLGTFALHGSIDAQTPQPAIHGAAHATPKLAAKYGSNPAAGQTFTHDGVRLYYEVYGTGEPLLIVHGNGSSIGELKAQIDHFRKRYRVIVMDSRDHGKSADSVDKISYEKMTDDLAALLDHLQIGPVGGIEALLLGIRHAAKVKKIAAMAANLDPSEQAIYPEVIALVKSMLASVPAAEKETPAGKRELKGGANAAR
jgi:pimeloyl-ACP methyl ester carboxylesterase